jgi:hypothetical protein
VESGNGNWDGLGVLIAFIVGIGLWTVVLPALWVIIYSIFQKW